MRWVQQPDQRTRGVSELANGGQRAAITAAADALRVAVHQLAEHVLSSEPDPVSLERARELVRQATEVLPTGPPQRPGPTGSPRSYRDRSPVQGALHVFASQLSWSDAAGPGGEPGVAFVTRISPLFAGPPDAVHGGYVAALFDELLGATHRLSGRGGGYTGRLQVRYRAPVPVGADVRFHGWVSRPGARRVLTRATAHGAGVLCAEAEALFVRPAGGGGG